MISNTKRVLKLVISDPVFRLPLNSNIIYKEVCIAYEMSVNYICFLQEDRYKITFEDVDHSQQDEQLSLVMKYYVKHGWPYKEHRDLKIFYNHKCLSISRGCLFLDNRVVLPQSLKIDELDSLHKEFWGIVKSKMLSRSYVWWPQIENDIERKIASCFECQSIQNESKHTNHMERPVFNSMA